MPLISEAEKLRRRESNESVLGTHAMEGLFPDDATKVILDQYAEGDLTLEQFSEAMDRHAYSLVAAHNKLAGAASTG